MKSHDDSLRDLTVRYLRGELNADELAVFELRLRSDNAARAEFRRATRLDANLRTIAAGREATEVWETNHAPAASGVSWFVWLMRWIAPVTAVALVTTMFWWKDSVGGPEQSPSEESAAGFAVVTAQANAHWAGGRKFVTGDLLAHETLRLESGIAQIELFSGVTVVVEGDAEFKIISPMEMSVTRGKVRARVPEPAHGFRIHTAEGEVVDLGTEFALNVAATNSEVHVLDGEVEWHPHGNAMRNMKKGEALRWETDGKATALPANHAGFIGMADMSERLNTDRKVRRDEWINYSHKLRHDPRLVVSYQMGADDGWNRRLKNEATEKPQMDGAIVAAARVPDRWGMAGAALDFSPTGSRVRLNVPGEFHSITLLTWVKINSLDRWYNSLFLTDGAKVGGPHWQIMDDGRLFFSVKKHETSEVKRGQKDKYHFMSPPIWNASQSGQWLMIATTYDVDARKVTHYLNGRVFSEEAIPEEYLVENVAIGAASICNWSEPVYRTDAHFAVRNLNGSMDEFALFAAALTSQEIADIYEHGKP
ncbi:MAG: FecR domain-containing protein [Verrucomicrobiaceae bacterium]|nr:FecR domain-containing protein [Verrucomicrobiaceae bacterium]